MKFYFFLFTFLCFVSQILAQNINEEDIFKQEIQSRVSSKAFSTFSYSDNYNVIHYDLNLKAFPDTAFIKGYNKVLIKGQSNTSTLEFDLSDQLTVDSIVSDYGKEIFSHVMDVIFIPLKNQLKTGQSLNLIIYFHGKPKGSGFGSFGIAKQKFGHALWTLSQPYGASDWWPCKNTLNDKADSVDITITTGKSYQVATNGLMVDSSINDTFITRHFAHRYPITSYLLAIAISNFEVYSNWVVLNNDSLEIVNYVYPETLIDAQKNTAEVSKMITLFSKLFIDYPFAKEKYGHAQFGWGGGMEHQTISFMGKFNWDLQAHELAHQWFGDWVTCASWKDVWLNEAFATYLNGLTYEYLKSPSEFIDWKARMVDAVIRQPDGTVVRNDTTNAYKIFDGRLAYFKGAMVLHMLREKIGDSNFYKTCQNYLMKNGGSYSFTSSLINEFESVSGLNLDTFFSEWYYGEGYPMYSINWERLPSGEVIIDIDQNSTSNLVSYFHIPVDIQLKQGNQFLDLRLWPNETKTIFSVKPNFDTDTLRFNPYSNFIATAVVNNRTNIAQSGNALIIYPNPSYDKVKIKLQFPNTIYSYQVTSLKGKLIKSQHKISNPSFYEEIDLSDLNSGEYLIQITNQFGQVLSKKVIKL